jgi:ASCH domain-containing protein
MSSVRRIPATNSIPRSSAAYLVLISPEMRFKQTSPAAVRQASNGWSECIYSAPPISGTLAAMAGRGTYVLNFYSAVFIDQLKRGRKTATIRLGDKSGKYERGQVVWVTVGFRHSPREKIFSAVIDDVEIKKVADLSPRDIEHDNPEFRRLDETINFLEQIYGREVSTDDTVTVIRFSQIVERPGSHFGNGETPSQN